MSRDQIKTIKQRRAFRLHKARYQEVMREYYEKIYQLSKNVWGKVKKGKTFHNKVSKLWEELLITIILN